VLQNVGMGFQKWSIDKTPKAVGKNGKAKWVGVWILGLLFQVVVVVLTGVAVTLGNASTLGAFAGSGLIALSIFSYFVLKEKIVSKEIMGMVLIILGTGVVAAFSRDAQSAEVHLDMTRNGIFFGPYLGAVAVGLVLLKKNLHTLGGAILGLIGGSMNGIGVPTMKIVLNKFQEMNIEAGNFAAMMTAVGIRLLDIWTWIMIVGGVGGMIVIQFGYKYGKAVQVVPGHAAMVVVMPAIAGAVLLGETVPPMAWVGIAIVTVGVLITTTADPKKHVQ